MDQNLKNEAIDAKLFTQNNNLKISESAKDIKKSATGSWNSRGWSARIGIVDVCFEETGKVLDVNSKTSLVPSVLKRTKKTRRDYTVR